ncbi:MAG: 2-hydroxyacyl-CoA dehydratase [Chitinivibrionales bacterium]|nr:2-hydroxyacyl-CoA dehydratase [Chitinivibrionales bacterium]
MDTVERISSRQWQERMGSIPQSYLDQCRFLRSIVPGGISYLRSPFEFACHGDRLLNSLKFDGGLASLRLWSFLFTEKERLFLAKERGWTIFAAMKDLGQVPIITYSLPNSLTFYADEVWWAPCFSQEPHLLEKAAQLGATDELCYVRAALGAYKSNDYFPPPDLSFAGVGSCCDDFSAVMQLIEWQGYAIHWWEIPTRLDQSNTTATMVFKRTFAAQSPYQESAVRFLVQQYRGIVEKIETQFGCTLTETMLHRSIASFNKLRSQIRQLRDSVYSAKRPPLPGLEMLLAEFIAIHACSDPWEAPAVLDDLLTMVRKRSKNNESPFASDEEPLRIFWVTPPTDAAIVTVVEDRGGCICGSDYMISHAFLPIDESKPALEAIAENYMDDVMIGSSRFRAARIVAEARRYHAEGVLITGIFGASHCPYEEQVITKAVREQLQIPVLSFDVPYTPGQVSEQVITRIEGFLELLRSLRSGRNHSYDHMRC